MVMMMMMIILLMVEGLDERIEEKNLITSWGFVVDP